MPRKGPANAERAFGLSCGGVLCLIAAALIWRGQPVRAGGPGAVGAVLVVLGALRPSLLAWPSAWWWRFARALGHVNARVLLTVVFVIILVPLGLLWRLTGKDPLFRRRRTWPGWSPYPSRYRDPRHYHRMY